MRFGKANKLVLVRHGRSIGQNWTNAYRDDDINFLCEEGVDQVRQCAEMLATKNIDMNTWFCSELTRARQTLMILKEKLGVLDSETTFSPSLNEKEVLLVSGERLHFEDINVFTKRVLDYFNQSIIPKLMTGDVILVAHYYVIQAIMKKHLYSHNIVQSLYNDINEIDVKNAYPYIFNEKDLRIS